MRQLRSLTNRPRRPRSPRRRRLTVGLATALVLTGLAAPVRADPAPPRSEPSESRIQDLRAAESPLRAEGALAWSGAGGVANPADHTLTAGAMNAETTKRVTRLEKVLPKRTLTNAIGSADRTAQPDCARDPFGPTAPQPQLKYCLDDADSVDKEWLPQGVSGVSDAKDNESWGNAGPDIQLFTSYDAEDPGRNNDADSSRADCTAAELAADDACNQKGVRVTFVKTRKDPVTQAVIDVKYQHALLVWTTTIPGPANTNKISYYGVASDDDPIQEGLHAGGIVWYGDFLYVADTRNGIRVFDVQSILDLDPDGNPATHDAMGPDTDGVPTTANVQDTTKIGRHGNSWYSYGYRYVIPQVAAWKFKAPQSNPDNGEHRCVATGAPKASYLTLDRSTVPDQLVMGEYCRPSAAYPSTGRIASYPVAALAARTGEVPARSWSNYLPVTGGHVQGVAVIEDQKKLYINVSRGKSDPGHLYRAQWKTDGTLSLIGSPVLTAVGVEALTIERGKNRLWSVSEYSPQMTGCTSICQRVLYAHDLTWLDSRP
ncbi:hypothetical protein AB0G74_28260 [Streptomyces sp. NPDC020875]|uniref:hypothetical protein n=1 Tax=Streptomyces sp. NPDC020875 TaxID=3154898 RepID=UPI0033F0F1AA